MSNFSLLGHAAVTRGENRRDVQLADLVLIDLEDETPKSDESAPYMIMTMRQGKQNQHGKIEYMGCMRYLDPILCPRSALAFYFFNRWGRYGAQPFPSLRQLEDYYGHYVFPGSVRVPERPLSYATQLDWSKKIFQGAGIHVKEKTHSARKQSVRHADLRGVSEAQIRRAGRWNTDAMTGFTSAIYLARLCGRSQAFRNEATAISSPARRRYPTRPSVHGSGLTQTSGSSVWKPTTPTEPTTRSYDSISQVRDLYGSYVRSGSFYCRIPWFYASNSRSILSGRTLYLIARSIDGLRRG